MGRADTCVTDAGLEEDPCTIDLPRLLCARHPGDELWFLVTHDVCQRAPAGSVSRRWADSAVLASFRAVGEPPYRWTAAALATSGVQPVFVPAGPPFPPPWCAQEQRQASLAGGAIDPVIRFMVPGLPSRCVADS